MISFVEYLFSRGLKLLCQPLVDGVGCKDTKAAVMLLGIIPRKERLARRGARFLRIGEASRVLGEHLSFLNWI